jgi:hypothetical protein
MSITFACECGQGYVVEDCHAGHRSRCIICDRELTVPAGQGALPHGDQADWEWEPSTQEEVAPGPPWPGFGVSPIIEEAYGAFLRDLPALMRTHPGLWVAYAGSQQLGFGKTKTELYQRCLARGLTGDDFLVEFIDPDEDEAKCR